MKESSAKRVFSGAPWEQEVGYCRALRVGGHIIVSGTVALDANGEVFAPGDAYAQTKRCLEIIEKSLVALESQRAHVVRTRLFVRDISLWRDIGRAHREFFAEAPPATSMLEIARFIDPKVLIEVEAEAIVPKESR